MDFFGSQARARVRTRRLVVLFAFAVLAITGGIAAVVALVIGPHPGLVTGAAVLTLLTIGIAALVRSTQLRSGGAAVAQALGATPVPATGGGLEVQRYRNVVEEIAIASGVPVPALYVLEQEEGINAFAAGWTPADAAVAVTRGALEQLDRDELQGVIAHEFSHILNGDMRLNIRLMGLLFGILVLALAGRTVLQGRRHRVGARRSSGGPLLLVALGVMVVGYVGVFFGRLIKAGVSRQREFLADAAAVQFTRQTRGLAGALKKIAAHPGGARFVETEAEEVAHMLFGDGVGLSGLFATHPPVDARLSALEGRYDADEVVRLREAARAQEGARRRAEALGTAAPKPPLDLTSPAPLSVPVAAPALVSALVGNPSPAAWDTARALRDALPDALANPARTAESAPGVLAALAVARTPAVRARQLAGLGADLSRSVAALLPQVDALPPAQRLPLAALAVAALRSRPRARNLELMTQLKGLMLADGALDLAEYCLARLVHGQVREALEPARARVHGRRRLVHHSHELGLLLAVLARQGHADPAAAQRAWLAGLHHALPAARGACPEVPDAAAALDQALRVLDGLDAAGKRLTVEALVVTLEHDGTLAVVEAELLRTVCAVLHCPLPPLGAAGD